jgi:hypothetical protein
MTGKVSQTEVFTGSRLATRPNLRAPHPPFSLEVLLQHAPQPVRLTVPIDTSGALLEGLHCLTASCPLSNHSRFPGDDRGSVFSKRLRAARSLNWGLLWNLNRSRN